MHSLLLLITSNLKVDFSLMCEFHHFQFQQKEPHCWGSSSLCELHFVIGLLLLCYYFHQNPLGGKSQPLTHHWVLNLKVVWTNTPQHWCTFLNASDSSPSKPLQYLTSHHILEWKILICLVRSHYQSVLYFYIIFFSYPYLAEKLFLRIAGLPKDFQGWS